MGIYKFKTKDSSGSNCELSVKTDFLNKCPNPEEHTAYELFDQFNVSNYLHNTEGPAFIDLGDNEEKYFINGKFFTKENFNKETK
jgi:hypothetical protein